MNHRWLIKMYHWARNPPSPMMVKIVLGVIAACIALFAVEYFWGWPEALTLQGGGNTNKHPKPNF